MTHQADLQALLAAQDWPGAERLLRRAAKSKSANASTYYNLGKVLEVAGKPEQSGAWYKKAVSADPGHANAWFELGRWAIDGRDWPLAAKAFAKAAALAPDDPDAWRNLGRVTLRLGHWDQAQVAWARFDDDEARLAQYRIAAERGKDTSVLRAALLRDPALRPEVLKTLVRTAKGRVPLQFPKL